MLAPVPSVDVVDSTWIAARPATLGAVIADPANWTRWWPGLTLTIDEWRGPKGVRWFVDAVADDGGAGLSGTAEVWLEPMHEGSVAHFFLRLDAAGGPLPPRAGARVADAHRRRTKQAFWALADTLDPGRTARLTSTSHGSLDGAPSLRPVGHPRATRAD
jgi:hypothetical protein